jgi:hypothetical protein
MTQPLCVDCRFFTTLDDDTRAAELTAAGREMCLQGLCRRNPPTVGRFRGEQESLEYDYGQWPLVLSCDLCGAFEPCRRAAGGSDAQTRHVGAGCDICGQAESECDRPTNRRHVAACQRGQSARM